MTQTTIIPIPGTGCSLAVERDEEGHLHALSAAGREYVRVEASIRTYDGGFVTMNEVQAPAGLLRHVRTGSQAWAESYLRDADGLPERVDGVEIRRDERGRIIACEGPEGDWIYRYEAEHLTEIITPGGRRRIVRAPDGRPIVVEENGVCRVLDYSDDCRSDITDVPSTWHRDEQGRLWAVTAPDGTVEAFYLWDDFHCLGRVDGAPGEPLAAVFSLDQTGTPVRIITRDGVTRIPRDAFGEGLLEHDGVPGLFGGARHGEVFHYIARVLDPRLGSYNAPDPWHGGQDDPRRADGYTGTLIVERPVAGPYAVCQYDPIGFVDPTGTIAWYYLLSTLTWAFPNNMLTWVGYELTLNFWGSLITGKPDRFFSGQHIYSERFGIGAMQLDGAMAPAGQVYTTQHIVWSTKETFEEHAEVTGFVPAAAITPTCYGTILRAAAETGRPVLLRGTRPGTDSDSGYVNWARGGGEAAFVAPGILVPFFPSGGFHFNRQSDLHAPLDAVMTELEPAGVITTGALDDRLTLVIARTGLGVADGALILLTDDTGAATIVEALSVDELGGITTIRLEVQTLTVATTGLRLRGLGARQSSESLTRGTADTHLNVTSTNASYAPGDALRLDDGTNPALAAILTAFQAQLAIDADIPTGFRQPMSVFALAPSGPQRGAELTATGDILNFPNDPIPNVGDFLTVTNGTTTMAVAVITGGTDRQRRLDRSVATFGTSGAISWQELTRGSAHGVRAGDPETGSLITYRPITRGTAPASGFIGVEDRGGSLTARTVTAVNHDVLVVSATLPAGTFTVDRFIPGGADVNGLSAAPQAVLALQRSATLDAQALRLIQLNADTVAGAIGDSVASDFTINGATATLPYRNASGENIRVSDAVVLRSSGNDIPVVLQAIEMTLELDRDMAGLDASDLLLVALAPTGPMYQATAIDTLRVVVDPLVGGNQSQMPRFFNGEIVQVTGTNLALLFRVSNVSGTTLTLEGDAPIPGTLPAAVTVQRMTVADPATGCGYLGREGVPVHPAVDESTRYIRFRFWSNRALVSVPTVGIISGGQTRPARVTSVRYGATRPAAAATPMKMDINPTVALLVPLFVVGDIVFIEWRNTGSTTERRGEFTISAVAANATGGVTIDVLPRTGGQSIATTADDATIRVRPNLSIYTANQPNAGNPLQLNVQATMEGVTVAAPQFQVNDVVTIEWTIGTARTHASFDVTVVSGGALIDVAPRGSDTLAAGATEITVRRLPTLDLTFTEPPPGAGATGEILQFDVAARHYAAQFRQESDSALTIMGGIGNLMSPSPNVVVVIPLAATAVTTAGAFSSGTVKAPDDPEHWEYDRYKAVIEHELRHTQQYNWFGPLWFCMFPMWIMDTITASTTDMEQPAYSAFVRARLRHNDTEDQRLLEIPDMQSIPFATGNSVQVYLGSSQFNVQLGVKEGNTFNIVGAISIPNGDVFVRRQAGGWGAGYDVFMNIMRALTPASVMNLLMTVTYGGVYQLLGRGIYLITRLVNNGTLLPATVEQGGLVALLADPSKMDVIRNEERVIVRMEDGKVLRSILDITDQGELRLDVPLAIASSRDVKVSRESGNQEFDAESQSSGGAVKLKNQADASNFSAGNRVEITIKGDTTVVRSIDSRADDGRVTFRTALPVSAGQVKVAPYETHTPGTLQSWKPFYPATVDPELRAIVTLHPVGDDRLTLLPRDRVRVLFDEIEAYGHTTTVTAVNGDRVELAEMIPTLPQAEGQELIVRITKIGRDDPTGWLDQRLLDDAMDAGWVRWVTDPFSQTFFTVQQHARGTFWDHFTRVASYLLGNNAWSLLPFGFYFWDGLFLARAQGKGYRAFIEQDASEHSGDLYSSIGRLRNDSGEMGDGEPSATMTVGDIALYWFWPGASRFTVLQNGGEQDAPGVHMRDWLCTMPFVTAETNTTAPNNGAEAAAVASEPGLAVPDAFFDKNVLDPRDVDTTLTGLRRIMTSDRGFVPMEPGIQRTLAGYMAFSRPTTGDDRHRVTIRTTGGGDTEDRDAQDVGKQVIFFNVRVNDVTVTINGVTIAEDTPVTLLQTQRVTVNVGPNGDRRYRATVQRPADGPSLRRPEDLILEARSQNTASAEQVEISRFYEFDGTQFVTGAIRGRGMHLPTNVDVPVRTFNVTVVNTPPVVASLPATADFTIYGGTVPRLRPGGAVFVLVAANVMTFNDTIQYNAPAPPGTIDPVIPLTDATADATQALRDFLAGGVGRPFRLALEEDDPPEEAASVLFEVTVGEPGNQATLSVEIDIEGHFIASNGTGYNVARGGTLVLDCAGVSGGGVTPLDTVQVTMTNGTPPPLAGGNPELSFSVAGTQLTITARADASTGVRRLLITDSANAANRARRTITIV